MNPVICYLTKNDTNTIKDLCDSLHLLYENFNNKFDVPVVVFHEKDFSVCNKLFVSKKFPVKFIEIELQPQITPVPEFQDGLNYSIGYRNMCQFFHSEYYKYLDEYDWFMRLDTDSFIIDKVDYNLFEYLESKNKIYGYVGEIPEWPDAVKHLDEWFETFTKKHRLKTSFYKSLIVNGNYQYRQIYNNFEIVNKEYFKNNKVQFIMSEINKSGNIYRWRWGDAPLRTLTLSLCYQKNKLHRFSDIGYEHRYFYQKSNKRTTSLGPPMRTSFNKWNRKKDWIIS